MTMHGDSESCCVTYVVIMFTLVFGIRRLVKSYCVTMNPLVNGVDMYTVRILNFVGYFLFLIGKKICGGFIFVFVAMT